LSATKNMFHFLTKFENRTRSLKFERHLALVHALPHAFAFVLALVHAFVLVHAFAIVLALARWRARSLARSRYTHMNRSCFTPQNTSHGSLGPCPCPHRIQHHQMLHTHTHLATYSDIHIRTMHTYTHTHIEPHVHTHFPLATHPIRVVVYILSRPVGDALCAGPRNVRACVRKGNVDAALEIVSC
jgi:hypothetical protein